MSQSFQGRPSEKSILCQCYVEVGHISPRTYNSGFFYKKSRLNVKLGGINLIPDPSSASAIMDPVNPTMVMGMWTSFYFPSLVNLNLLSSLRCRCYTPCSRCNWETILYGTSCQCRRGERKICCRKVERLLSSNATNWRHLQNLEYKPLDKKWLLTSRTWAR